MFFFLLLSIELTGPLVYYFVFNGTAYRSFQDIQLIKYWLISVVAYSTCLVVISPENIARPLHRTKGWNRICEGYMSKPIAQRMQSVCGRIKQVIQVCQKTIVAFVEKILDKLNVNWKWFYVYMIIRCVFLPFLRLPGQNG